MANINTLSHLLSESGKEMVWLRRKGEASTSISTRPRFVSWENRYKLKTTKSGGCNGGSKNF